MRRMLVYLCPILVGAVLSTATLAVITVKNDTMPDCGSNCHIHDAGCLACCDRDCSGGSEVHHQCIRACD